MRWLRNWKERRQLKRRALFAYHDGTRIRYADPAIAWRDLVNHPTMDFGETVPLAAQGKEPATTTLLNALAEVFSVERWDESTGRGLTNWELLDLLRQFDEYLAALKKNTNPSRTPWLLSAYGPSTGISRESNPEAEKPISSTAGFSSMQDELNSDVDTIFSGPSPTQ